MHTTIQTTTIALRGRQHSQAALLSPAFRHDAADPRQSSQPGLSSANLRKIVLDLIG